MLVVILWAVLKQIVVWGCLKGLTLMQTLRQATYETAKLNIQQNKA